MKTQELQPITRVYRRGQKYHGEGKDRHVCRHQPEHVIFEEEAIGFAQHRVWRTSCHKVLEVLHNLTDPDHSGRLRVRCMKCGMEKWFANAAALPAKWRQLFKEILDCDNGKVFEPEVAALTVPVGVAVLPVWNRKVALSQRARRGNFGGYWQGAGGKLEEGEPPAYAAVRELHEETGIGTHPAMLDLRACELAVKPNREKYHLWVYVLDLTQGRCEPPELAHTEPAKQGPWVWFPVTELPSPLMPLYREALSRYFRWGGLL